METLEYQAAMLAMGTLSAENIRSTISTLMDDGYYTDECLDALDSSPATFGKVLPAFRRALEDYRIEQPDKEQAVWQLIRYHSRRIVSENDSLKCLEQLIADVYWDYDFHAVTKKYLGDSHDIERIVGLYWELDDVLEHSAEKNFNEIYGDTLVELKNHAQSEALRWLAAHPD